MSDNVIARLLQVVNVGALDNNAGYLSEKLTEGSGITLTVVTAADGSQTLEISAAGGGGGDELVKVNALDSLAKYLEDKIVQGAGITITEIDTGGVLSLSISADNPDENIILAISDEGSDLTTGTAKLTFRMPYAFTLTGVRASVTTAPTGATVTVDINESGVSILSTKLTIDATEKTSTTAATPAVISDADLADDAEITIDIDQIGSTIAGAGLKVTLLGNKT